MSLQTKVIGRTPTDHGPYNPNTSYGKKFCVTLFGCMWESLHDNNNTAPAVWDGGDTITPNLVDWKKVSGDYNAWLMNQNKPAQSVDYPFNGMGRVKLLKHVVDGHNLLYQDDFYKDGPNNTRVPNTNTVFEVPYEFELAEDITIPAGCILDFQGGSISGTYTLTGQGTRIIYSGTIFDNVHIEGTWNVGILYSSMFVNRDDSLKEIINLCDDDVYNKIIIEDDTYNVGVNENDGWVLCLKSNTDVEIQGTVQLLPNAMDGYGIFYVSNKENIHISGNGKIIGDKNTHTGSTGEAGMGIYLRTGRNVSIKGVEISNCFGDGVYSRCDAIEMSALKIHDCRRQGISVIQGIGIYIKNCEIYNISGLGAAQSGIDIEPNQNQEAKNVFIENNYIHDCAGACLSIYLTTNAIADGVIISNNKFIGNGVNDGGVLYLARGFENVEFYNNTLKGNITIGTNVGHCLFVGNDIETPGDFISPYDGSVRVINLFKFVSNTISCGGTFNVTGDISFIDNTLNTGSDCAITADNATIIGNRIISEHYSFRGCKAVGNKLDIKVLSTKYELFSLVINTDFSNNNVYISEKAAEATISNVFSVNNAIIANNHIINSTGSQITISNDMSITASRKSAYYNNEYESITFTNRASASFVGYIGSQFFDYSLGKPVWYDGTQWVDATGTPTA